MSVPQLSVASHARAGNCLVFSAVRFARLMPQCSRLNFWLAAPVDNASLAFFRFLFGILMAAASIRFMAKGWVGQLYLEPAFHFPYPGFEWIKPWPGALMYAHFILLALLAFGIALGIFYRVCATLFFFGFTYIELIDQTAYLNHYYLITLLAGLLIILPAHRAWSIDAWRKPPIRAEIMPAWCLNILRFQIGVVYVFAGLAKFNADWLFRAEPLRIWLAARSDLPLIGHWLEQAWVAYAASWFGAIFDTTIIFFLLQKRTRRPAYALLIFFHVATWFLFNIGMFPWIMIVCATVFFPPDCPRYWLMRLPRCLLSLTPRFSEVHSASAQSQTVSTVSPLHARRLSSSPPFWSAPAERSWDCALAFHAKCPIESPVAVPLQPGSIPKGLRPTAQGCEPASYPGSVVKKNSPTLKGLWPTASLMSRRELFSPTSRSAPRLFSRLTSFNPFNPFNSQAPAPPHPILLLFLGIYAALQLALPLRPYFSSQPSAWTCSAFNCAWRVMIAEKTGYVEFYAVDPETGSRRKLSVKDYLTPRQEMMMAQDPYLIRQMARHLASSLETTHIAVTVEAFASLNGRPSQPLVDPGINLAGPTARGWIVALNP